jgi:mRNA interferase HigB
MLLNGFDARRLHSLNSLRPCSDCGPAWPRLREFAGKHPDCGKAVAIWIRKVKHANWDSMSDVVADYPKGADPVGSDRIVFNLVKNNYRIVVAIYFKAETVWVKFVGTHKEYDRIDAATVSWRK